MTRDAREGMWSAPDELMLRAGASGELMIARVRLIVLALLLPVPILGAIEVDHWENAVGATLVGTALVLALIVFYLAHTPRRWLSWASAALDVSLVSAGLAAFLVFGAPHTSVNSLVIFETYLLALAATALRYDPRICVFAGVLAMVQYGAIVLTATSLWELNDFSFAPFEYGVFRWSTQVARLLILASAAVIAIVVVMRLERLLRLSSIDFLTGLYNRSLFDERVAEELRRTRRYRRDASVALVDVDNFKDYNDVHGHAAGDDALQELAAVLRDSFRATDVIARYGGEEFVILLPETPLEDAAVKLERVRQQVADHSFTLPRRRGTASLTLSGGVATFPQDGDNLETLLEAADQRLLRAKRTGRDRVIYDGTASIDEAAGQRSGFASSDDVAG